MYFFRRPASEAQICLFSVAQSLLQALAIGACAAMTSGVFMNGEPWPAMPPRLLELWNELTRYPRPPEACLVNVYDEQARMGLHQDRDEEDLAAPILSLSLGADCRFRLGGTRRGDRAVAFPLSSGDALVLSGPARLRYHGVDRILPTVNAPLPPALSAFGVRVNLTLRRVA